MANYSGEKGDLLIAPKLLKQEFNKEGIAQTQFTFAGIRLNITFVNEDKIDYGVYVIEQVYLNDTHLMDENYSTNETTIQRHILEKAPLNSNIKVVLGNRQDH